MAVGTVKRSNEARVGRLQRLSKSRVASGVAKTQVVVRSGRTYLPYDQEADEMMVAEIKEASEATQETIAHVNDVLAQIESRHNLGAGH